MTADFSCAVGYPGLVLAALDRRPTRAAVSAHLRDSVHLHLVPTGPGGGTWDNPVGQSPAPPSAVTIVAEAVGFCRLIANRTTPADLDPYITGDRESADAVLAAAGTLTLD